MAPRVVCVSAALAAAVAVAVVAVVLGGARAQVTKMPVRADGTFKLVTFADMHYSRGEDVECANLTPAERQYPCSDFNTTDFMGRVLDAEKPDLVVFTGDNLAGGMPDPELSIRRYSQPVVDRQIPWAVIFGNHDEDQGLLNETEMMTLIRSIPYSVSEFGPSDVFGTGNYFIQIVDGATNVFNLWFLDSGRYSAQAGIDGYDWVRPSQIAWYSQNVAAIRNANGGRLARAVAFFHIPIIEYTWARERVGTTHEGVYHPDLNSGLYTAFVEAGDVIATVVGHDHTNDYCGKYYNLNLCYAGGTGFGDSYGWTGWARRSRVIQFTNNANGTTVETWKRLANEELEIKDVQTLL